MSAEEFLPWQGTVTVLALVGAGRGLGLGMFVFQAAYVIPNSHIQ